jgi:uncharacterized GH25 family protein
MTNTRALLLFLFLSLAGRTFGHDVWLEPATYRPAAGQVLTIRILQGEHFRGEPVARDQARVEKFILRDAAGERAIGGVTGDEPAGRIAEIAPGDAVIGYRTRPRRHGRMTAGRFEAYLREEGLERIIEERARRGQAEAGASEMYSRSVKSLVKRGSGSAKRYSEPLGLRLELIPETDPHDRQRPTLIVRLMFDGRPLSGALVTAMHHDDAKLTVHRRSDGEGRVTLPIAKDGAWLIKAVHMIEAPEGSGVDWESIWASLTFERRP